MQSLDLKRFQAMPGDALAELLRKYSDRLRFRMNKKQAQIARDAWLDESYVSRLISGERANPSRDALILLGAFGLELPGVDLGRAPAVLYPARRRCAMTQQLDDWNTRNIKEFRASGGKLGGPFEGAPVLLLTHTGAKSGTRRTNPLVYLPEAELGTAGERMYIFGSKGGASTNPDWYHNLLAHPVATVEAGAETFEVEAAPVTGEERDRIYARQAALQPTFGQYQKNTSRKIPVIALTRKS